MTSYICPICGVASNLKPQYNDKNDTTAVSHYFTYCGHKADDNHRLILPQKSVKDWEDIKIESSSR
jgi:hypothetical protein